MQNEHSGFFYVDGKWYVIVRITVIGNKTLLIIIIVTVMICPNLANSALAFNYDTNYPVTNTNSAGYAFLKDPSTGISVALSNADNNVSFGIMVQKLTESNNEEKTANLTNPEFFGIALLGISDGNARMCIPDGNSDLHAVMQYLVDDSWYNFSNISVDNNIVCGNVSVSLFMGDNFTSSYTEVVIGGR